MDGCPVVALGSDAARQGAGVKASFEAGIREYLEMLGSWVGEADGDEPGRKAMVMLSTMVGAVVLSRAVNDERLSKRFLQAAAEERAAEVVRGQCLSKDPSMTAIAGISIGLRVARYDQSATSLVGRDATPLEHVQRV